MEIPARFANLGATAEKSGGRFPQRSHTRTVVLNLMKELYQILKKVESRPAMWTGENSLKSIKTFLDGYLFALEEYGILKSENKIEISFNDWIAEKLGFYESTAGWPNMILAVTLGLNPKKINWENYDKGASKEQHEESIRKFYELYEEFVKRI